VVFVVLFSPASFTDLLAVLSPIIFIHHGTVYYWRAHSIPIKYGYYTEFLYFSLLFLNGY